MAFDALLTIAFASCAAVACAITPTIAIAVNNTLVITTPLLMKSAVRTGELLPIPGGARNARFGQPATERGDHICCRWRTRKHRSQRQRHIVHSQRGAGFVNACDAGVHRDN